MTRKGTPCANRAKYGSYCNVHRSYLDDAVPNKINVSRGVSLVESLDPREIGFIADYMSIFGVTLVRATCTQCSALVQENHDDQGQMKIKLNDMLCKAARYGHRDLCVVARKWGATMFDVMISHAALGGHRDLCELARKWGATKFDNMIVGAAKGGHRDLCVLARKWGAKALDVMMSYAALSGHRDLCELAREWGATDFNWMLRYAVNGNHRNICELAQKWIDDAR